MPIGNYRPNELVRYVTSENSFLLCVVVELTGNFLYTLQTRGGSIYTNVKESDIAIPTISERLDYLRTGQNVL